MLDISMRLVTKTDLQQFRDALISSYPTLINANDIAILQAIADFVDEGFRVFGGFYMEQLVGLIRYGIEKFGLDDQRKVNETLIGTIFVHPLYRDQGIGKRLVDYALGHASTPHILADPIDEQAHHFFTHCGFEPNHLYDLSEGGDWLMIAKTSKGDLKEQFPI